MTASLVGALVLARAVDDEALSEEILQEVIGQFAGGSQRDVQQRGASD
jgi:hypothetical protein